MKKLIFVLFLWFAFGSVQSIQPQLLDKIKKEVKKQIESNKKEVPKSVDTTKKETKPVESTKRETDKEPQLVVNSKYDFVPGEKIIFFDDFTAENIGDFPVQWNTTGSGEVVSTNLYEGRWFQITNGRGATTLNEPVSLPENYTIEFDVIPMKDPKNNNGSNFSFYIISTTKPKDLIYGLALNIAIITRPILETIHRNSAELKLSQDCSQVKNTEFQSGYRKKGYAFMLEM
jgi:hypothetical protein